MKQLGNKAPFALVRLKELLLMLIAKDSKRALVVVQIATTSWSHGQFPGWCPRSCSAPHVTSEERQTQ